MFGCGVSHTVADDVIFVLLYLRAVSSTHLGKSSRRQLGPGFSFRQLRNVYSVLIRGVDIRDVVGHGLSGECEVLLDEV